MSGPNPMRELTCDEVRELSGAFVLGALDASEDVAVRAHLAAHVDAHPEIAELGSVIPAFVEIVPIVEPPAGLKDRILAAAAADLAARGGSVAATPPVAADLAARGGSVAATAPAAADLAARGGSVVTTSADASLIAPAAPTAPTAASITPAAPPAAPIMPAAPVTFPSAEERAARRSQTSPGTWVLRIAAVLAIALLGGWNLLLQNQLSGAQGYERNVATVLDSAAQPGSLTAVLAAGGGTGTGIAAVQEDGELAIAMRDLAPTTGASVYEAWVIGSDGVPVPVGNFRVGDNGIGFLQADGLPSAAGIVLALTLEPGQGATAPTMPIISSGVAGLPG